MTLCNFVHFQALPKDLAQDSSPSLGLYALYSHTLVKLIFEFTQNLSAVHYLHTTEGNLLRDRKPAELLISSSVMLAGTMWFRGYVGHRLWNRRTKVFTTCLTMKIYNIKNKLRINMYKVKHAYNKVPPLGDFALL